MTKQKTVLLYRTSGENKPSTSNLQYGELAMGYASGKEKLYLKNTNNQIASFISETQIDNKLITKADWGTTLEDYKIEDGVTKTELSTTANTLDNKIDVQDNRVADAVGLAASNASEDGEYRYVYASKNEILTEFHNASDSIDYLATQLKACKELIESMKQNIYMMEVDFTVTPNADYSAETVSFSVTHNGEPTSPSATTITKTVNNYEPVVIFSGTSETSSAFTSTIEGAKEHYEILVYPNSTLGIPVKSEVFKYLSFVGASSADTITKHVYRAFDKEMSNGIGIEKTVTTKNGEYVWIVVPDSLQVTYVTNSGMTFSLNDPVQIMDNVSVGDIVDHIVSGVTETWINYNNYYEEAEPITNPEFVEVILDAEDKIVYGERVDGTVYKAASDYELDRGLGMMKAYRSHNQLDNAEWNLVINNIL